MAKNIKIKVLAIGTNKQPIEPGEEFRLPGWAVTLAPDDLTIIGYSLVGVIDGWPDVWVAGEIDCSILIGKVASIDLVNNFGLCRPHVSIGGVAAAIGPKVVQVDVMFPVGHGIELDEGEGCYLNGYLALRAGPAGLDIFANALVQYIER